MKAERNAVNGEERTVVRGRRIVGAFIEVAAYLTLADRKLAAVERRYQPFRDEQLSMPALSVRVNSCTDARGLCGQFFYEHAAVSLASELRQISAVRIHLEVYVFAAPADGSNEHFEAAVGIYRIVAPCVSREHGAFGAFKKSIVALVFNRAEPHGALRARISVFSQWKELISNRGISSFSGKLSNIKVLQPFISELLDDSLGVSGYEQLLVGGQNENADL